MTFLFLTETINFQNNLLTDESNETLMKLMTGQPNLKYLDLTNNRLNNKTAETLAAYISCSSPKPKLEVLNLSLNSIKDEGVSFFSEVSKE